MSTFPYIDRMDELSKFLSQHLTEPVQIGVLVAGLILILIAYYWLAFRAVAASKWWRIGYLPPFALFYLLSFSRRVIAPLVLFVLGAAVFAAPFVYTHVIEPRLPMPEYVKIVDGELHFTVTGKPDFDYTKLQKHRNIVWLQMANPDVTDSTLELIKDFPLLRVLDIDNSQITDAGLATLRTLPKLETLRVKNTRITDAGFKEHFADYPGLKELDARDTGVLPKTIRAWKNAQPDRKALTE